MADATIIMAGGSGSRLWPASTPRHPKQLLRLGAGSADGLRHSLVQQAALRALAATPSGPVVVVTHRDHVGPIAGHMRELASGPAHDAHRLLDRLVYLPEPVGRNTAPAIALGIRYLERTLGADASVLVLTADHVIRPVERFAADALLAARLAADGRLVCFGITPTHPETGYGYIQAGDGLDGGYVVDAFREKPDQATAQEYLRRGNFYWNSGMFCFTVGAFSAELAAYEPAVAQAFADASAELETSLTPDGLRAADADRLLPLYERLPGISVDYAVMERSRRVAVVPASFSWSDVGSWDEAAKLASPAGSGADPRGAAVVEIEASGNHVDSDLPLALCGVSDLHVIVKNGRVLVCRRGASQLVKQAVDAAAERGLTGFVGESGG